MSTYPLNVNSDSENTSSDSESNDEFEVDFATSTSYSTSSTQEPYRKKREIAWCGVDTEFDATATSSHETDPSISLNNSENRNWQEKGIRMQLFCRVGHLLAVYPDGKVRGTQDSSDLHTILEMVSLGHPGHVLIRGVLSNLYVTMTEKGRLRAQANRFADNAVFLEGVLGFYITYLSRSYAHLGWYMGIKKSGKFKNGSKTKMYQKAVHFIKRYKN